MIVAPRQEWQTIEKRPDRPCKFCRQTGRTWLLLRKIARPGYVEHEFWELCTACLDQLKMEETL